MNILTYLNMGVINNFNIKEGSIFDKNDEYFDQNTQGNKVR